MSDVLAHHTFRAFEVNYIGNQTIGFCMPQWQGLSYGNFNGQGDVESQSHPREHGIPKQCYLGKG